MLLTKSSCKQLFFVILVIFQNIETVTNFLNQSLTSSIGHQYLKLVTNTFCHHSHNIRHQPRCRLHWSSFWFPQIKFNYNYCFKLWPRDWTTRPWIMWLLKWASESKTVFVSNVYSDNWSIGGLEMVKSF